MSTATGRWLEKTLQHIFGDVFFLIVSYFADPPLYSYTLGFSTSHAPVPVSRSFCVRFSSYPPVLFVLEPGRPPSDWIALHRLSFVFFGFCFFPHPQSTLPTPFLPSLPPPTHIHSYTLASPFLFTYPFCVLGLLQHGGFSPFGFSYSPPIRTGNWFPPFIVWRNTCGMVTCSPHGGPNAHLATRFD